MRLVNLFVNMVHLVATVSSFMRPFHDDIMARIEVIKNGGGDLEALDKAARMADAVLQVVTDFTEQVVTDLTE